MPGLTPFSFHPSLDTLDQVTSIVSPEVERGQKIIILLHSPLTNEVAGRMGRGEGGGRGRRRGKGGVEEMGRKGERGRRVCGKGKGGEGRDEGRRRGRRGEGGEEEWEGRGRVERRRRRGIRLSRKKSERRRGSSKE